ncbi:MAG: transglutaminase domain-containing protein [Oscillospiraceae bacterium]|nr:transglutaminase domain-containing protein [Oscillospiraceae bacterium]
MKIVPYTSNINEYLKSDDIIDHENVQIKALAEKLYDRACNELDFIRSAYEYVRDNISHSADINEDIITCSASEVLAAGHGICFAKAHLLAAVLRCKGIPAGLCYQRLILDDEAAPVLIMHGLNGVYLKEYKKWIRLDPRGNKNGVNAQFSVDREQLAFPVRSEKGEEDCFIVFPETDRRIREKLRNNKTRTELWEDLPTELENPSMRGA